jgi:hypothetical protein
VALLPTRLFIRLLAQAHHPRRFLQTVARWRLITIKKLRELAGKSRPMAVRLLPGRASAKADILLMTMTAGELTSWQHSSAPRAGQAT